MAFPENTVNDTGIKHIWDKVTAALSSKVDKVSGKGLSTNDYTTAEKDKLAGIESGAQVNAVTSVAGKTGAVTLAKGDVELGNVDNTSDLDKPISTATQTALNNKADSEEVEGTQTATGNPITLTDASETYAQGLSVELEPKQDLHGYDFPWVGGAGKNKLPMTLDGMKASNTTGTWSGNTYTINGGTFTVSTDPDGNVTAITVNGTFNAQTEFRLTNPSNLNNSFYGYILNGSPTYPNSDIALLVTYIEGGMWKSDQFSYNEADTTINQSFATIIFSIYVKSGTGVTDKVFKPMIRLSTETDPTFAPWENKCPISGYEGVEVEDVGKNLFDKDSADNVMGYWINTNNGTLESSSSGWNTSGYIRVEPSTAYSFTVESSAVDICCFDEAKTFISGVVGQSVTTPQNCVYIRFDYKESEKNYVQLEKFTTRTPYEPYQSRTASVTFGQTVYGGKSDFVEGGTDDEWENVDLGTDAEFIYIAELANQNIFPFGVSGRKYDSSEITLMCDSMKCTKKISWDIDEYEIVFVNGEERMRVRYPNCTTLQQIQAAMTGVHLCYEKATPDTISTPLTDLKLLQDTNNLTTNGTTITLDYIPNNSIGDAVKASEEYTDRAVERVAVAPKATLIDTWMISEESDTISVDLTAYDCNFFLLEYLFHSKRGTTLIPRPQGGSFSASVVTYYNGSALYIELDYNPTTKVLSYTSNITSDFGILAIYTI